MPIPAGYTNVEDAPTKWGVMKRSWWYARVRKGDIKGWSFPGERGTYVEDKVVEAFLQTPRPKGDQEDEDEGIA